MIETAYDLDLLDDPVKMRPLIVETTTSYLVWVEDYDDRGAAALAQHKMDYCDYDLHKGADSIDGSYVVREPELWDVSYEDSLGPWRLCPAPGCARQQYPGYGVDPTCSKHRVTGCQHQRLPLWNGEAA